MRQFLAFILFFSAINATLLSHPKTLFSAKGTLTGRVLEKKTKEPMFPVKILLKANGQSVGLDTLTDMKGDFRIPNIPSGFYDLEIRFGSSYDKLVIKGVKIEPNLETRMDTIWMYEEAISGDPRIFNPKLPNPFPYASEQSIYVGLEFSTKQIKTDYDASGLNLIDDLSLLLKNKFSLKLENNSDSARIILHLIPICSKDGLLGSVEIASIDKAKIYHKCKRVRLLNSKNYSYKRFVLYVAKTIFNSFDWK